MRHRGRFPAGERAVRSRLAQLAHARRLLCGSLVRMERVCGKPGCKCTRGEKHPALCLAIRVGTGRKLIHVPVDWEETIGGWVGNYQEAWRLVEQISQASLKRFLEGKEQAKAQKAQKRTSSSRKDTRRG